MLQKMAMLGCMALVTCRSVAPAQGTPPRDPQAARAMGKASGLPLRQSAADAELAQAVRQRLADHPSITVDGIEVSVRNGVVTLGGRADSDFEKRQAERSTGWLRGVKRVRSELVVESELFAERADADLEAELVAAFALDPRIESRLVGVHVQHGVVTLSGTLPDWDMVDAVLESTFARLPRAVVNRLERQHRPQRPSEP